MTLWFSINVINVLTTPSPPRQECCWNKNCRGHTPRTSGPLRRPLSCSFQGPPRNAGCPSGMVAVGSGTRIQQGPDPETSPTLRSWALLLSSPLIQATSCQQPQSPVLFILFHWLFLPQKTAPREALSPSTYPCKTNHCFCHKVLLAGSLPPPRHQLSG